MVILKGNLYGDGSSIATALMTQEGERPYSTPDVTGTEKYSIFDLESCTIEFDYDKEDSRVRIEATSK